MVVLGAHDQRAGGVAGGAGDGRHDGGGGGGRSGAGYCKIWWGPSR